MRVPTVHIKSDNPAHNGYIVINESDFDSSKHERYIMPLPIFEVPTAEPTETEQKISVPKNYARMEFSDLRKLAEAISGRTPENKEQAVQIIAQYLAVQKGK